MSLKFLVTFALVLVAVAGPLAFSGPPEGVLTCEAGTVCAPPDVSIGMIAD